jgi:hypothetical protein
VKDKGRVLQACSFQTCLPFGSDLDGPAARKRELGGRVLNVVLPWSVDEHSSMNRRGTAGINPAASA